MRQSKLAPGARQAFEPSAVVDAKVVKRLVKQRGGELEDQAKVGGGGGGSGAAQACWLTSRGSRRRLKGH